MTMLDLTALRLQQQNARQYVRTAIKTGKMKKPDVCAWCGRSGQLEGHHTDYAKPLEVLWLCKSCHRTLHNGLVKALQAARVASTQNSNLETKGAGNDAR